MGASSRKDQPGEIVEVQVDPVGDPQAAERAAPGILDDILAGATDTASGRGIVIGTFCGHDEDGRPQVDFPHNPGDAPLTARSTVVLDPTDVDRPVALLFENNDPGHPVVIGLIQPPAADLTATVDDETVVLEARRRIELRCGKAKIVLTEDGRVLVKGTDVMSRSAGPNRVKGASVQIN